MKPTNALPRTAKILAVIIAVILVLLPFHAFLTVWLSSGLGHYTLLRLWKEILLIPVFIYTLYILLTERGLRSKFFASWITRLILIYSALMLVTGAISYKNHDVTAKALAYGILVDLRFLIFFLMVVVVVAHSSLLKTHWRRLVLWPSVLVAVFAILQYLVLPYNFLSHFGYGPNTISPYETINNSLSHIRVASTLRGPNPLGAYLVLVISVLASLLVHTKKRRLGEWLLGVALIAALIFSYSRSAWIGAIAALAIIVWPVLKAPRLKRWVVLGGIAVVLVAGSLAIVLRNNSSFQDDLLHTNSHSTVSTSSNQGHDTAFRAAIHDIAHQPLGRGPGTAGPASVYNNNKVRLAENYFLQIGQEVGVIGMVLFIAINVVVGRALWLKRADPLAMALLASLVGLSIVNMLAHAWADDTLSYIWWGLAAIALSPAILKANKHSS